MPIDNNILEREIRVFATGRKSWLFSDTADGAKASAVKGPTLSTCCRSTSPEPKPAETIMFQTLIRCQSTGWRQRAAKIALTLELVEESFIRGEPVLQLAIVGQAIKAQLLQ
jgi:hypothetical protein